MERIPAWDWLLGAAVFFALGIVSATDGNWSGSIISALLVVACAVAWRNRAWSA